MADIPDDLGSGRPASRLQDETERRVVMMCGIAGSGKTTYAQELEQCGYIRLSIDEAVWALLGRDGGHLDQKEYEDHQARAEDALRQELVRLMRAGRRVVLDYSFWRRATRDRYKSLIESHGYRWELVYLKANPETLRRRLAARNALRGPNRVTVSEDLLRSYLAGFEEPVGEGERVMPQE
ncbi:AAA family ATPase [Microbispora catharanthi]|uniref:AAA family ATPase n=1 Tax=Microbispora catharanthi TaxID=1712871 RepID=A0A5N6BP65_9ACTN|nr:ATP-binding protein [Microbispora catharanthi]KAB8181923.1 AAA family ATPase [Microbispora catharanthi]